MPPLGSLSYAGCGLLLALQLRRESRQQPTEPGEQRLLVVIWARARWAGRDVWEAGAELLAELEADGWGVGE